MMWGGVRAGFAIAAFSTGLAKGPGGLAPCPHKLRAGGCWRRTEWCSSLLLFDLLTTAGVAGLVAGAVLAYLQFKAVIALFPSSRATLAEALALTRKPLSRLRLPT